jgi:hypothetical protein
MSGICAIRIHGDAMTSRSRQMKIERSNVTHLFCVDVTFYNMQLRQRTIYTKSPRIDTTQNAEAPHHAGAEPPGGWSSTRTYPSGRVDKFAQRDTTSCPSLGFRNRRSHIKESSRGIATRGCHMLAVSTNRVSRVHGVPNRVICLEDTRRSNKPRTL